MSKFIKATHGLNPIFSFYAGPSCCQTHAVKEVDDLRKSYLHPKEPRQRSKMDPKGLVPWIRERQREADRESREMAKAQRIFEVV